MKRKVSWTPPIAYFLGGALLALFFTKSSTAFISVCPKHRAARRNAILVAFLLALAGFGGIFGGASMQSDTGGFVALAGAPSIAVGLVWGIAKGRLIFATKITKEFMWLGGCKRPFLESLSEWNN